MSDRISCYIMSGGIGSRLWPLSREDNPKQFHDLSGSGSMLLKTVRRARSRKTGETPANVIASSRHAGRLGADLANIDLGGGAAIYEPVGRNTAPAVAVAAAHVIEQFGDGLVLIMPSDHEITTDADFWNTIEAGAAAAKNGQIVVFGIKPSHPETGYGYIKLPRKLAVGEVSPVERFVEKPDLDTAKTYLADGSYFWNTGIFLFQASSMKQAFSEFSPVIWSQSAQALHDAQRDATGIWLPAETYEAIDSISIDYAIMEQSRNISMTPASFQWNDLGSWQSLLDVAETDSDGNVLIGDVVAIDCKHSYLRSQGRLLSVVGLDDIAVVATSDAVFVAPVSQSQNVRKIVGKLESAGRLETKFTPAADEVPHAGAWVRRVQHWLFDETLPLWSTAGVDWVHGGFHEALSASGDPLSRPKRMRTMARQTYAFAVAQQRGWDGPAIGLIDHGISFMERGRTDAGGWVRTFNADGTVLDPAEDAYDTAFVLLALAHAHKAGSKRAAQLGKETFAFLDSHLEDGRNSGFLETTGENGIRRANPHMHMLEAFLAWHAVTGEKTYLRRAVRIADLFRTRFFDPESWTVGEFFNQDWQAPGGSEGQWTEPGHHFEWAWLLADFAAAGGQTDVVPFARKIYASALANGLNRATGLAYAAVSRDGVPLDTGSRSWPQTEAIKAAIALHRAGPIDMLPEIETRVARLFRWHIDSAAKGLWIDQIDERGRVMSSDVPASIFYHLVSALTEYLNHSARHARP